MSNINKRCPLQPECGRKCAYHGHEQDCDYYIGNTRPGYEIPEIAKAFEDRTREMMDLLLEDEDPVRGLVMIPLEELHPHPDNPRKSLEGIEELAESIKSKGILQNLTVAALAAGGSQMDGVDGAGQAVKVGQHVGKTLPETFLQRIKAVGVGVVAGNGALAQHLAGFVTQNSPAAGAAAVDTDQFHRLHQPSKSSSAFATSLPDCSSAALACSSVQSWS